MSRIKLPFKLGDSKKTNEFEINETSKKDDFSLSEVRYSLILFFKRNNPVFFLLIQSIRLYVMVFHIDQQPWLMILYKKFLLLEQKMVSLKCKFQLIYEKKKKKKKGFIENF